MPLPIVILPTQEKWDCHQCGICCRGSIVPLSEEDLARLRSQKWEEHPDYLYLPTVVPIRHSSKTHRLAQRADGCCVFLKEDGLCRIHAELGYEAKPTICRVFPLQLVPRDKQVALTIRRACPSSAIDLGQELKGHLPFIQQLVREDRLSTEPIAPPPLKSGEVRDWKTIRLVLDVVSSLLQDNKYPPVRRLVHALQFATLLKKAQTKGMTDSKVAELAHTLADLVPEESKPFFEDRRPPAAYAKIFFRQIATEFARLHPEFRPRANWAERLKMAKTAWRVFRGRGPTPAMHPPYPLVDFEELENPLGHLDPAIDQPLSRLIETSSASYLYALADRQGWSIIDSVRGLAILFPVGLWLLRWASHGREATLQDMVNIVVALDRGQGYRSLTGPLQRWRLSTLSSQGELERLVVWYAR